MGPLLGAYVFILISNDTGYVRIEGIEIDGSNVTNAETLRGITLDDEDDTMEDNRISHCLIHDITNSTIDDSDGSWVRGIRLDLTNNTKVSNNIIYNLTNVSTNVDASIRGILANNAGKTRYIYNNTVYNIRTIASTGTARGIYDKGGSTVIARNNYVGLVDSVLGPEQCFQGSFAAESNNVSSDATAAGAGSQINQAAYASYFVSTAAGTEDLHLLNDSFTLWGSNGADLDSDPNLPVTDDIDGGVRDGSTPDIGADELGAVSCSPTLNFRSIGIQATPLANTGTASVGLGATTVDFSGVSLPANVGLGDELVFAGETLYVLWRVSSTQVTVQTPAAMSHTNESYTIQRAFRGATPIQDWETARQGDLIAGNRREVGVAYNDGVFTAGVVIGGSTTDSCHFMQLTAASGQRHAGTAGTGVVLDGGGAMSQTVNLLDDYTRFEWFEVRNYKGATGHVVDIRAQNVLVSQVIVHDFGDVAVPGIDGISIRSTVGTWSMTVCNSIVYDGGGNCIQGDNADDTVTVENVTVYGCKRGISEDAGSTVNVRNTIAMDNTTADFVVSVGTQSNNLSSDGSAPGPVSLPPLSAVNQFVNITPGDEVNWDLHLKVGADAIDVGTDLSAFFVGDIDDTVRPAGAGWDMGADELGAATAVELISFTALGEHGAVFLEWETGSEIQNLGFHLYRSTAPDGSFERITESVIPGLGSSPAGATYSYRDSGLTNGVTYFYQLEDIETTGKTEMHGPVSATPEAGAGGTETEAGNHESLITYGDPTANSFRVVKRGRRRVVLELMTEGFYAEPQEDGTVLLDIPDFEPVSEAGSPSIPVTRPWIEALAGRKVKITAVRAYSIERVTGLPVAGTEALDIVADRRGTVRAARRSRRASFRGKGLFPKEAARLVSVGFQGDVKKAQLELAPLRWDSATGHLLLARRLVVVVSFSGVEPEETTRDGIHGCRRRRRERRAQTEGGPLARLVTTDQGLHEVRFEDVFSGRRHRTDTLRLSHRTDTLRLRLSRHAEPVAFHVVPDAGRFGPGSKLYFLSEGARANPYGHEAVYELDLSGEGLRMEITSAPASGASASYYWSRQEHEENRYYQAGLIDINDAPDLWLWDAFIAPVTKSFPFQITDLAPTTEPARLSVWLQGVSDFEADPDHHLRIYVNGSLVQETSWDGKRSRRVEAEIGPGVLTEGENSIEIESVRDTGALYSLVMLDRFAVEYPRLPRAEAGVAEGRFSESSTATLSGLGPESFLVDVTGGGGPRWIEGFETTGDGAVRFWADAGRSYLVVSAQAVHRPVVRRVKATGLRGQTEPVDYLVIAPARFLDTVAPLVTHRREQGLRTKAVAIEDVYETFGFGEARPEAIRDFIEFAYHHWPEPALRYVLLVGDASYDYKNYLKTGVENHVPPLMVKTSYLWTVSDPTLGAVNGEDNLLR